MNIYVVVRDDRYDGYSEPLGVFSTKEKANEYIQLLPYTLSDYRALPMKLDEWNEEWL